VIYRLRTESSTGPRFGVIVSKQVGGAVVRNRVRRRIQSVCADALARIPATDTIVIRALPGAGDLDWASLRAEVTTALDEVAS
jgi:ribonuclease P protein component